MNAAKLRTALYRKAVQWVAQHDPLGAQVENPLALGTASSVRLCAYLWDRPVLLVVQDVKEARAALDKAQGNA